MKRHMLMIGGSREIHPKAKALGLSLSVIMDFKTLKTRKTFDIFDHLVGVPNKAPVADWIAAAKMIHSLNPVHSIGAFSEHVQHYAVDVAKALGLQFHSYETLRATLEKDFMRELLIQKELDDTQNVVVKNDTEIKAFAEKVGFPLILKPKSGRGSLCICLLRSADDIAPALEKFKETAPKHEILAEEYLEGSEWSVEGFSENGVHKMVCVTQKFKDPVTLIETGHCVPGIISEADKNTIMAHVTKILGGIGLRNGPTHTEVILTKNGPKIVETHARLGGDSIVELIWRTSGIDLDELWVRQLIGESVMHLMPTQFSQHASISYVIPNQIGILKCVTGNELAQAIPHVVRTEILQEPGNELFGGIDSFDRGASAVAVHRSPQSAIDAAQHAVSKFEFHML